MTASGAMEPINLAEKLALFDDVWSPKIVTDFNELHVKVVKLRGEFVWHTHEDTDELFLVISGEMVIQRRDGEVRVGPGELYVVPRGVEHRPVAAEEVQALLIESAGTINTGETDSDLTAPEQRV